MDGDGFTFLLLLLLPLQLVLRRHDGIAVRAPLFFANFAEAVAQIFRVQARAALTFPTSPFAGAHVHSRAVLALIAILAPSAPTFETVDEEIVFLLRTVCAVRFVAFFLAVRAHPDN